MASFEHILFFNQYFDEVSQWIRLIDSVVTRMTLISIYPDADEMKN